MADNISGTQLLKKIKKNAGSPESQFVLPVYNPPIALLRPVATQKKLQHNREITLLTNWRNKCVHAFLTEFKASVPQTSNWLTNCVHNDINRILFMVNLTNGRPIGCVGLAYIDWKTSYGEIDTIIRGESAPKGTMRAALIVLSNWAKEQLGLKEIGVRVLSDNPALKFYKKCGFIETKRVPLNRRQEYDKVIWFEDKANIKASRQLVYHLLKKVN